MNHQRMERHEEILGSEGTYINRENATHLFFLEQPTGGEG